MDQILSAQYDSLEKALATLIDTIAAYNPSPQAALDLVAADDDLSRGLDQLAKHQANHARIQALRTEAEALEEKRTLRIERLAALRHNLFDTPTTTFPETSRAVTAEELLQYASYISKHTVPPTYRERVPGTEDDKEKVTDQDDAGSSAAPTNGVNTPMQAIEAAEPANDAADAQKEGDPVVLEITAEEEEWLKKLRESQFPWYPWPSIDKIRAGNLQKVMYHRERGDNLDVFDIKAHYAALLANEEPTAEPVQEAPEAAAPHEEHQHLPKRPQQPAAPRKEFDLFDDLDE